MGYIYLTNDPPYYSHPSLLLKFDWCSHPPLINTPLLFETPEYSLSSFSAVSFSMFVILTVVFLFLGVSIVCVNNLKRTVDSVLWFPDKTSVCTQPWHQNDVIVFMVSLNLTKLKPYVLCTVKQPCTKQRYYPVFFPQWMIIIKLLCKDLSRYEFTHDLNHEFLKKNYNPYVLLFCKYVVSYFPVYFACVAFFLNF